MIDILQAELRRAGYSLTKPRLTVFGALQSPRPRTMQELTSDIGDVIDRASIYRAVKLFEELGIVNRIQHGFKYRLELSDAYTPHHHHLTCRTCQRVMSFDEPVGLDSLIDTVAATHGFVHEQHNLEIFGLCPRCRTS